MRAKVCVLVCSQAVSGTLAKDGKEAVAEAVTTVGKVGNEAHIVAADGARAHFCIYEANERSNCAMCNTRT